MGNVMSQIDKANGYIYGKAEDDALRQMFSAGATFQDDKIATVRERLVSTYQNLYNILLQQPYPMSVIQIMIVLHAVTASSLQGRSIMEFLVGG